MRLLLLLVILTGIGAAPANATLWPSTEQSLAAAYKYWEPDAYCNGSTPERSVTVAYDASLAERQLAGQATGIVINDDGTFTFTACKIVVDPKLLPPFRCRVIIHEVGHLDRHVHAEGGIMEAQLSTKPFAPCDPTRRQEVTNQIEELFLPKGYKWTIHCTPALRRCRATAPNTRYARRFLVSDNAEQIWAAGLTRR